MATQTAVAAAAAAAAAASSEQPLESLAIASYRWGQCQAIRYDTRRTDLFERDFIGDLYDRMAYGQITRNGRNRTVTNVLRMTFCGMPDLSKPAIISYLYARPLVILGEWSADNSCFLPLGYCFTVAETSSRDGQRNSAFGGYCFFPSAWRTPQQYVLTTLGLAYLFREFRLVSLHGIRYDDNKLTARWMAKFGFQDIGTIPNYMQGHGAQAGTLVPAVVSTLDRAEFEHRVRIMLEGSLG